MEQGFAQKLRQLLEAGDNPETIGRIMDLATDYGFYEAGEAALGGLADFRPGDDRILGARVALLLMAGKYQKAMSLIQDRLSVKAVEKDFLRAALAVRRKLGPLATAAVDGPDCRICLCMIVRNEAEILGRCLHSVKDLVHEIVVVDTGSEDDTAAIAEVFGARVFNFQWNDDFSAARNFALEKVGSPWVLVLDADEIIARQDLNRIRSLVKKAGPKPRAYSIMTRNYTRMANVVGWQANDGSYSDLEAGCGWYPSWKVRLFQPRDRVKFRFAVHERVDPALKDAGIPIEKADVVVHHYGSLDAGRAESKAKRYYELAMAKIDEMRHDPAALRELAIQAGQLEKWDQAVAVWQQFLKLKPDWAEAYVNLAGASWQMGRYTDCVRYATRALDLDPGSREAGYNKAVGLLLEGRAAKAAELLERLAVENPGYLAAEFQLAAALAAAGAKVPARKAAKDIAAKVGPEIFRAALTDLAGRMEAAGLQDMASLVWKLNPGPCPAEGREGDDEITTGQVSGVPA